MTIDITKRINYLFSIVAVLGFIAIPVGLQMSNYKLGTVLLVTPAIICGILALIESRGKSFAPFPLFIFTVCTLVSMSTGVIMLWAVHGTSSYQTVNQVFLLFYCTAMLTFSTLLLEDKQ